MATEVEREALVKEAKYDYTEMKADALALFLKGFGSRPARRILYKKYKDNIVASRTMRLWFANYTDEVKAAVGSFRQMDVLIALETESSHLEDISDDILHYAIPSVMKDMKANKFDELSTQDKLQIVLKEINSKAQRVERRMQRLDPQPIQNTFPIFIQRAMKQSSEKMNGSSNSGDTDGSAIIDAEFEQVADLPPARIPAEAGDSD